MCSECEILPEKVKNSTHWPGKLKFLPCFASPKFGAGCNFRYWGKKPQSYLLPAEKSGPHTGLVAYARQRAGRCGGWERAPAATDH